MKSERSRCALSGCDTPVPTAQEGRPPRRYCSPEHHAEARGRGREALAATDDAFHGLGDPTSAARVRLNVDGLAGLPSTRERRRQRRVTVPAAEHEEFTQWKKARATRARRTRQLVGAVGVAGMLAAGGTFIGSGPAAWLDSDHLPRTVAAADWESQARVALSSIDRQINAISATQAVWDSQIAPLYAGTTPAAVQAMLERKTLLEQQRAALQGQLATADQLAQARAQLADLDRQLAQITAMLDGLPHGKLSPDQQFVRDSLNARRDLLEQERSARQADLARLQQSVSIVQTSPVPDPADQTTPLTSQVLDLRNHRPAPPPPPVSESHTPPAAGNGERRDAAVLADGAPSQARKPVTPLRPVSDTVSAVGSATQPVRDAVEGSPTPRGSSDSSGTGSGSHSSGSGSSRSGSSGSEPRRAAAAEPRSSDSGSDSGSDSSGSGSSGKGSSGKGSSGGDSSGGDSSGGTRGGMTAAEAYNIAMNSPSGRMAQFIGGASGAPAG